MQKKIKLMMVIQAMGGSVKLEVRIEPVLLGLKTKNTYYAR